MIFRIPFWSIRVFVNPFRRKDHFIWAQTFCSIFGKKGNKDSLTKLRDRKVRNVCREFFDEPNLDRCLVRPRRILRQMGQSGTNKVRESWTKHRVQFGDALRSGRKKSGLGERVIAHEAEVSGNCRQIRYTGWIQEDEKEILIQDGKRILGMPP